MDYRPSFEIEVIASSKTGLEEIFQAGLFYSIGLFSIFFKNGPAVFCKASLKEYLVSMNSIQAPAVALMA